MACSFLPLEACSSLFRSEQECIDALFTARWPEGFRCPSCLHAHYYLIQSRRLPLYECRNCSFQTSIIAGTIMAGSRTPLTRWFYAIYLLAQPGGISSRRLSQLIHVTYKTAWLIARKIRYALERSDLKEPLVGQVHIQSFNYGYEYYPDARQPLLIGANVTHNNEIRQIKIKQPSPLHINNDFREVEKAGYSDFINKHIHKTGFPVTEKPMKSNAVLSPVKKSVCEWLNETFKGIGPKHLQAYLDEYCFRFNYYIQQASPFAPLLYRCAAIRKATYKQLTRQKAVLVRPWTAFDSKSKWKGAYLSARSY